MSKAEPSPVELSNGLLWQRACHLLQTSEYELAAELLSVAQHESEQNGQTAQAAVLSACHRICLACRQCQAEVAWVQQVQTEAERRENELKQELFHILALVPAEEMSVSRSAPVLVAPPPDINATFAPPRRFWRGLVRWVRGLFEERSSPTPAFPEVEVLMPIQGEVVPVPEQPYFEETFSGQNSTTLAVYCLGKFRVYQHEQLIEKWPGHKCKSLFKYLLMHRGIPVHQEVLMELFWPEVEPEAARRNLYQAVYHLRQALQAGNARFSHILCEENCYGLNPEVGLWIDSEVFTLHYQHGQQLEREGHLRQSINEYELAESLYQGEFLAEDLYEDWPLIHRQNLKHAHLEILDRLSRYYFEQAQWVMCINYCQKILGEDNCREDAHRRLMRCYLRQGQRHLALRQYHLCVEVLKQELDVPPMPATTELYRQIQENRV